ncbi:MAG: LPS export ABC transporter permease LptG [Pseudohongiellaceae bacterium]
MRHLDSHIRNTVLASMAIVIALITSLDIIFALLEELADTGGDYTVVNALVFVALTSVTSIYELLPFAALGGALIGLGVLASNQELVVMQSAGVHAWRIVLAVLQPTLLVMILGLGLGEYVAPPLEQVANSNRAVQVSGSASIGSQQGTWRRIGQEYIHINAIAPGGETLFGVTRYRVDANRQLQSASFAESAEYREDEQGGYWQLANIRQSLLRPDRIDAVSYRQEDWRVDLSPALLSVLLVEPDKQSISGLYRLARFFDTQGLDSATYYLAFWKKLLQPLSTLALVILAVSFIFGPLREATTGFRVFVALAVGLLFTIVQRMMEPASLIYGFSPLLAVLTPIALVAALGVYYMRQVR